jgi:hypothetical protein
MKPKLLIRIAAGCILFFALGHTIGHSKRHDVIDPKAKEVQKMMIENKFDLFGKMRSYDESYTGMSLNLIFTLMAFSILLWIISSASDDQKVLTKKLLVPIALCILGFSVTGFLYFFMVPAVTCLVAFILTGIAIFQLNK